LCLVANENIYSARRGMDMHANKHCMKIQHDPVSLSSTHLTHPAILTSKHSLVGFGQVTV